MAGQGGLAEDLRAGLEITPAKAEKKAPADPLDELWHRKPVRQHVREFGSLLALLLVGYAALLTWRSGSVATIAALTVVGLGLFSAGAYAPRLLVGVWRGWMKGAEAIGLVMTTLILSVGWIFLMIPTSLALRLFRISVMNTTFREPVESYWETRDPKMDDFKLLERQF